jgi:hypothetical protein
MATGAMLVVFGTAISAGWIYRQDMAAALAMRWLERAGMGPARLEVGKVGLSHMVLRNISLYGGAISVAQMDVGFELAALTSGTIGDVKLSGLRVALVLAGGRVGLSGGTSAAPAPGAFAAISLPGDAFRITRVQITDGRVTLDAGARHVQADFATDLAVTGASVLGAGFSADIALGEAGQTQTLHVAAPELALSAAADGSVRMRVGQAAVIAPWLDWSVADVAATLALGGDQTVLRLVSAQITDRQAPARVVPLKISGDATMTGTRVDFTWHAVSAPPAISIDAKGFHDLGTGRGNAAVSSVPLVFRPKGQQPRDLFPRVGAGLPVLSGSVSLGGGVGWHDAVLAPALTVRLADIGYEPAGMTVSHVGGNIAITGLAPLVTAPGQILTAAIASAGLPPANVALTFQLLAAPALRIEALRTEWVGGQITASPFTLNLARPEAGTTLSLHQVDLAEIFHIIGNDGLSGTGRLDGEVELSASGTRVRLRKGSLAASGPGVLQLRSSALPKQIVDAGDSMTLVLQAIADFHYDKLALDLAEDAAGNGTILLKIEGRNPAVLEGRVFHLNIKLESNFDRLIDLASRTIIAAQAFLRQTAGGLRP